MATSNAVLENVSDLATPVLHILVIGFHHQKGSTIEFSHPSLFLTSQVQESLTTSITQSPWRNLPHLALPDGCHNFEEESVFFTLPDLDHPGQSVFGVACCRQIEANKLKKMDDEITRSTVQKSICVISRYPVFEFIEAKLSLVTHAFFNAKDFSNMQILRETYNDINSSLSSSSQIVSSLYLDITLGDVITRFQHRLLQMFKALLVGKRVVLFAPTSIKASKSVLSILSLFPKSLESYTGIEVDDLLSLNMFSVSQSFQPYLCLQQMEELKRPSSCVLAGVVNPLFEKQQSKICDVFADVSTGIVAVHDHSLKPCLHLSTADLRFCSILSETICEREANQSDWLGSNDWIRVQFKHYLISLLKTSLEGDDAAKDEFNSDFMRVWCESPVYKSWLQKIGKDRTITTEEPKAEVKDVMTKDILSQTLPMHMCTGELSISDLKRRFLAQASDYGLNVGSREEVVQQTQEVIAVTTERVTEAVSRAWTSASNAVYKWWGGSQEEDNDN